MAGLEKAVFMNMCMIYDEHGRVLALDKVSKSYGGTTFPGGHVEPGETFRESVIREIREETGLTIQNPRLTGIYHWMEGDEGIAQLDHLRLALGHVVCDDQAALFLL